MRPNSKHTLKFKWRNKKSTFDLKPRFLAKPEIAVSSIVGVHSITPSWNHPLTGHSNVFFRVSYAENSNRRNCLPASAFGHGQITNRSNFKFNGLKPNTEYVFQVVALWQDGTPGDPPRSPPSGQLTLVSEPTQVKWGMNFLLLAWNTAFCVVNGALWKTSGTTLIGIMAATCMGVVGASYWLYGNATFHLPDAGFRSWCCPDPIHLDADCDRWCACRLLGFVLLALNVFLIACQLSNLLSQ